MTAAGERKRIPLSLQIVIGIAVGVALGPLLGARAAPLGELGKLVIQLIKAVATPLLFFAIVNAILTSPQLGRGVVGVRACGDAQLVLSRRERRAELDPTAPVGRLRVPIEAARAVGSLDGDGDRALGERLAGEGVDEPHGDLRARGGAADRVDEQAAAGAHAQHRSALGKGCYAGDQQSQASCAPEKAH